MKTNYITIKGQDYEVIYFNEDNSFLGKTDVVDKTIKIDNTLNEPDTEKVIFHELLHAFFHECGLMSYSCDEILIHFLDSIYFDLISLVKEVFAMKRGSNK